MEIKLILNNKLLLLEKMEGNKLMKLNLFNICLFFIL